MALLNYHFINWLLEFDRILVFSNTYRAKVPSYDENRDISLHFDSELHCMIQQLFQVESFNEPISHQLVWLSWLNWPTLWTIPFILTIRNVQKTILAEIMTTRISHSNRRLENFFPCSKYSSQTKIRIFVFKTVELIDKNIEYKS